MTCPGKGKKPEYLQSSPAAEAAMDARRARSQHRWTKSKKPSSARKSGNWNRRAWPGRATCRSNRCALGGESWAQRSLSLRQRQEIQEVSRRKFVKAFTAEVAENKRNVAEGERAPFFSALSAFSAVKQVLISCGGL